MNKRVRLKILLSGLVNFVLSNETHYYLFYSRIVVLLMLKICKTYPLHG